MNFLHVKKYYHLIEVQDKFTYSLHGKVFEKQIKIIEDRGEVQIKAIAKSNALFKNNDIQGYIIKKRQREIF